MFGGVLAGGSRWDDSGEYFILTSDIGRWQIFDKTLQLVVADYNIRGGFAAQERFHPQEAIFARNEDDSVALYHEWEEAPFERYAFVGDAMVPAVWSPDGESLLLVTEESLAYQKTTLHILHFE
jgi:hypothetical protein